MSNAQFPLPKLQKVYEFEDLRDWLDKCRSMASGSQFTLSVEPKVDGLAVRLRYEHGQLVKARCRSADILDRLPHMANVLQKLARPLTMEIRGEIFMGLPIWKRTAFKNPAIAASTVMRSAKPAALQAAGLYFLAYELESVEGHLTMPEHRRDAFELMKCAGVSPVHRIGCGLLGRSQGYAVRRDWGAPWVHPTRWIGLQNQRTFGLREVGHDREGSPLGHGLEVWGRPTRTGKFTR